MKNALCVVLMAFLPACALLPEKPLPKVPVAIGCLGPKPARPVPKFGQGPYPGDKAAAQVALSDYAAIDGYATALEVTMAGCDPKPPAPASASTKR